MAAYKWQKNVNPSNIFLASLWSWAPHATALLPTTSLLHELHYSHVVVVIFIAVKHQTLFNDPLCFMPVIFSPSRRTPSLITFMSFSLKEKAYERVTHSQKLTLTVHRQPRWDPPLKAITSTRIIFSSSWPLVSSTLTLTTNVVGDSA